MLRVLLSLATLALLALPPGSAAAASREGS